MSYEKQQMTFNERVSVKSRIKEQLSVCNLSYNGVSEACASCETRDWNWHESVGFLAVPSPQ